MLSDTNEFLQSLCEIEEWLEKNKSALSKPKRSRKSKLFHHRLVILQKRADGKSFQQIADFLHNVYKIKCDKSTVFDFYTKCISE